MSTDFGTLPGLMAYAIERGPRPVIPRGADISLIIPQFLAFILSERLPKCLPTTTHAISHRALRLVSSYFVDWVKAGERPMRQRYWHATKAIEEASDAAEQPGEVEAMRAAMMAMWAAAPDSPDATNDIMGVVVSSSTAAAAARYGYEDPKFEPYLERERASLGARLAAIVTSAPRKPAQP